MTRQRREIIIRNTEPADFDRIFEITKRVYPDSKPWRKDQLVSHLEVFPEGQFVAAVKGTGEVVGMAASLIIHWDDYDFTGSWQEFTSRGMFTNHDPENGRTLYGAEIMVDPKTQRLGVGSRLYAARRELVERLELRRIRSAARLSGYHRHAGTMSAEEYVIRVIKGKIKDPTLSFQLQHGFDVIAVVPDYLQNDSKSLCYASVIEWINPKVAKPGDYSHRDRRFRRPNS